MKKTEKRKKETETAIKEALAVFGPPFQHSNRKKANKAILRILLNIINANPDYRFGQLMYWLMPTEAFYEESDVTLQKIKNRVKIL